MPHVSNDIGPLRNIMSSMWRNDVLNVFFHIIILLLSRWMQGLGDAIPFFRYTFFQKVFTIQMVQPNHGTHNARWSFVFHKECIHHRKVLEAQVLDIVVRAWLAPFPGQVFRGPVIRALPTVVPDFERWEYAFVF